MQIKKISRISIIFQAALYISSSLLGMEQTERDPYIRIKYRDAFDQKEIHKTHADLMRQLSCNLNVFNDAHESISSILPGYDPRGSACTTRCSNAAVACAKKAGSSACSYAQDFMPWAPGERDLELGVELADRDARKAYLDACHNKLWWARFHAVSRPAVEGGVLLGLLWASIWAAEQKMSKESYGGTAGIMFGWMNSAFIFKDMLPSILNIISAPKNDMEEIEERFAANQCFIPKALWPKIIDQFGMARTNQYQQQAA